jgi:hypothetical protein
MMNATTKMTGTTDATNDLEIYWAFAGAFDKLDSPEALDTFETQVHGWNDATLSKAMTMVDDGTFAPQYVADVIAAEFNSRLTDDCNKVVTTDTTDEINAADDQDFQVMLDSASIEDLEDMIDDGADDCDGRIQTELDRRNAAETSENPEEDFRPADPSDEHGLAAYENYVAGLSDNDLTFRAARLNAGTDVEELLIVIRELAHRLDRRND